MIWSMSRLYIVPFLGASNCGKESSMWWCHSCVDRQPSQQKWEYREYLWMPEYKNASAVHCLHEESVMCGGVLCWRKSVHIASEVLFRGYSWYPATPIPGLLERVLFFARMPEKLGDWPLMQWTEESCCKNRIFSDVCSAQRFMFNHSFFNKFSEPMTMTH